MKQEKNDKVSLNISQTAIVLIIAMVFTGLSIQIARFHSHSRRGAYARVKNTCAGTLAENRRGAYSRGGGVKAGFYGTTFSDNEYNHYSCDCYTDYSKHHSQGNTNPNKQPVHLITGFYREL